METNLAPDLDLAFVDSDDATAAVAHPERRALLQALARRGLTERIYRPVGRRFAIDPAILGNLDAGLALGEGDRWAAGYSIALSSRTTREIAELVGKAGREGKRLATAGIDTSVHLATPMAMEAFVADLARAIGEVVSHHEDQSPGARSFRVTSCMHPGPAATAEPDNAQE